MPETITKEDGTEVEVFTQEELEAQSQSAIDKYKEENPDKSEEIEDIKKQLADKEEELEKIGDKDYNFSKLRKSKEDDKEKLEGQIEKLTGEMTEKLESAISNIAGDKKTDIIDSMVGEDEELKKKVEFHYDRIKDDAKTKEEIEAKVKDAYVLSTRKEAPTGDFVSNAGAGNGTEKEKATADEVELGNALGITEEDRKKYSN